MMFARPLLGATLMYRGMTEWCRRMWMRRQWHPWSQFVFSMGKRDCLRMRDWCWQPWRRECEAHIFVIFTWRSIWLRDNRSWPVPSHRCCKDWSGWIWRLHLGARSCPQLKILRERNCDAYCSVQTEPTGFPLVSWRFLFWQVDIV